MRFYLEITLLPNPEVGINFLWSKVFQQIHLGLVEAQDEQGQIPVGVSFPEYETGEKYSVLGRKLRLLAGDEAALGRFDAARRLSRLSDYVHCTGIRPVPEKLTGYATYQRQQPKTGSERLARRYAKRHNVDYDTALARYSAMPHKTIATPFIHLKSLSGDQEFCLWIKKTVVAELSGRTFSSYGLSAASSVPEF
ncbi:type I-F CRISPR-associated endoribonuclease Cas6/Csy4 [Candidatus Methylobacter oryzae]|uniref:Type I-F CRISPR-associated endoribonuclease Cas6/Csy4 n=1 Tax=Candidatus Methylobacter oryzae TaxID=2497749 RepID=A0ABY3CCD6_9GAMM|nr:type I-F CRISPR-associated endoribonuclease Cas6/Csy4 [Candidatus Methylobacter oryzae]TRW97116.1 type I-F CRISPR-associated endoribonuclease Cas6/Csy4 [Candidatus Methylobacter oryzae]